MKLRERVHSKKTLKNLRRLYLPESGAADRHSAKSAGLSSAETSGLRLDPTPHRSMGGESHLQGGALRRQENRNQLDHTASGETRSGQRGAATLLGRLTGGGNLTRTQIISKPTADV